MSVIAPIQFINNSLVLLDQRELPHNEVLITCESLEQTYDAIKTMVVRGAPCIGFSGIYGLALWFKKNTYDEDKFSAAAKYLISARPTAVNLEFEINQCVLEVNKLRDKLKCFNYLVTKANDQINQSERRHFKMAKYALQELKNLYGNKKLNILTHCNTGFLACGSLGTALGVIEHLAKNDLIENVWVDETRPYLQGSRLTSYELKKLNIPHQIVVEGCASHLMMNKMVDAIFVGADRIVLNGDTANKIGTANLSIIAKYYEVPFYVVAPISSFDFESSSGDLIEIELRNDDEILAYGAERIAPLGASAFNPSFDVSKGENISSIICERGALKRPYIESIGRLRDE